MTKLNNHVPGRPFEAHVHSTDASSGVAIPIFEPGGVTAITLASDEYLTAVWAKLVTVVSGDAHIFIGADATLGTGEVVVRGTYAANGGFAGNLDIPKVGLVAGTLWVIAPAGVVDAFVHGTIRKVDNTGAKPSWREAELGG
jgi:hypothetical protein